MGKADGVPRQRRRTCRKREGDAVYGSLGIRTEFAALTLEAAYNLVCHRCETESAHQERLQRPALRGGLDRPGGLLVPALPAELPRHRRAIPGTRSGGRPLQLKPLGARLHSPDQKALASVPQAAPRVGPDRRDLHQGPRRVALPLPSH